MYGATIGKLGLSEFPLTTNQAVAFAVPEAGVLSEYLFWFLRSQRPRLIAAGKGGAQPNISQAVLKDWPVPLPDIDAQASIVAGARSLDEGLRHLRADIQVAQTRAGVLRRALLTAAFSGSLANKSLEELSRV